MLIEACKIYFGTTFSDKPSSKKCAFHAQSLPLGLEERPSFGEILLYLHSDLPEPRQQDIEQIPQTLECASHKILHSSDCDSEALTLGASSGEFLFCLLSQQKKYEHLSDESYETQILRFHLTLKLMLVMFKCWKPCAVFFFQVLRKAVPCRQGMQRQGEEKARSCYSYVRVFSLAF